MDNSSFDKFFPKDAKAYKEVFYTYYAPLCRFVFKVLKDHLQTEDVVQEVFVQVWEKRDSIKINSSLKSYLYRACYNAALNFLRKRKGYSEPDPSDEAFAFYTDPEVLYMTEELGQMLRSAVDDLPPSCRNVFMLSRNDKLTYNEISDKLDISVKTVENHMSKALKILKERLSLFLRD